MEVIQLEMNGIMDHKEDWIMENMEKGRIRERTQMERRDRANQRLILNMDRIGMMDLVMGKEEMKEDSTEGMDILLPLEMYL